MKKYGVAEDFLVACFVLCWSPRKYGEISIAAVMDVTIAVLLGYPVGAASGLLDGTLKFRDCRIPFARELPSWSLPKEGHDATIFTPGNMGSFVDLDFPGGCVLGGAGGLLVAGGAEGLFWSDWTLEALEAF